MAAIQAAAAEPSAAKAAAAWETDMSIWNAIILGLVQGIAEFLPISSSGHLAILQNLMGLKTAEGGGYVFFDVLLHLGTLISICIVYWSEIVSMVRETVLFFKRSSTPEQKEHLPAARELLMIVIATLPLFLILPVKDKIEGLYYNTLFVGCALIATGAILFFSDRRKAPGKKGARSMTVWDAVLIGCCQAVATAPGISRSGTTIAGGLVRGLNRSFAVNFSFLMSVPAVLGGEYSQPPRRIEGGNKCSRGSCVSCRHGSGNGCRRFCDPYCKEDNLRRKIRKLCVLLLGSRPSERHSFLGPLRKRRRKKDAFGFYL